MGVNESGGGERGEGGIKMAGRSLQSLWVPIYNYETLGNPHTKNCGNISMI